MRRLVPLGMILFLSGALVTGVPSASEPAAEAASSPAGVEKQIRAALARWVEAANRQDWKAALDVWAPDLIGWYPGQPDDTYAREAENAAHPKPGSTTFQLTVNEVIVDLSMAVVRDTWVMTTKLDAGRTDVTTIRGFEVWRRQGDGAWRISRWISAVEPGKK
jgi:ketosteroid isomerase-like protein